MRDGEAVNCRDITWPRTRAYWGKVDNVRLIILDESAYPHEIGHGDLAADQYLPINVVAGFEPGALAFSGPGAELLVY